MSYLQATGAVDAAALTLAAFKLSEDPHLSEVTCQVLRLSALEEGRTPGPPCARTPLNASPGKGIGLRHAVVPIRVMVKARENPIVAIGFIAGVTLAVFGVGYLSGKKKRAA